MSLLKFSFLFLSIAFVVSVQAQSGKQSVNLQTTKKATAALPQYKPTRDEMLNRYKQATLLDSTIRNKVFKTNLQANWQPDGESFWYRNSLKDSVLEYIYVNAANGTKQKAFDHAKLAQAVGKAAGKTYDPLRLRIGNMLFENNASQVTFQLDRQWWECDGRLPRSLSSSNLRLGADGRVADVDKC